MKNFQNMGLPEALLHTLQHMQFTKPTPVQAEAIPLAMAGRDIIGSAQTGTGKTGAFGIPLVAHLMKNSQGLALVMVPTRELATQVMTQLQLMLGKKSKIKTALLIGGESMGKQLQQLRNYPRVIVGTPGRINDHLRRDSLRLHNADFLVLDETDRMLDMGFTVQIEAVLKYMTCKRQTLLFSATLPKNISRIAAQYLVNPAQVSVDAPSAPATNIQQEIVRVGEADKYAHLLSQLAERKGSVIIFVKTKYGTEKMARRLAKDGHTTDAVHGDLRQNRRDRVVAAFRQKKYRILVATDVAARGLDIPHIEHVINYDLPQCAEDYVHRIGRTARAGAKGFALSLIGPSDNSKWRAIEGLLNLGDPHVQETFERKTGPKPKHKAKKGFKGRNKRNTKSFHGQKRSKRFMSTKAA